MGVNAQENTSHDVSEVDKVIKMNMNLESKLKIANTPVSVPKTVPFVRS